MSSDREEGRFTERISLEAVLGVFDDVRGPVVTSGDVGDRLDCSRETARRKLRELEDAGRVASRKTAGRVVWWRTDAESAMAATETDSRDATLTPHQRTLYEIIDDRGTVPPGELYEEYRERVADPKSDRTVRNYLSKLDGDDLIRAEGSGRGRVYRSVPATSGKSADGCG